MAQPTTLIPQLALIIRNQLDDVPAELPLSAQFSRQVRRVQVQIRLVVILRSHVRAIASTACTGKAYQPAHGNAGMFLGITPELSLFNKPKG